MCSMCLVWHAYMLKKSWSFLTYCEFSFSKSHAVGQELCPDINLGLRSLVKGISKDILKLNWECFSFKSWLVDLIDLIWNFVWLFICQKKKIFFLKELKVSTWKCIYFKYLFYKRYYIYSDKWNKELRTKPIEYWDDVVQELFDA
jgi:hypothetical protein